MTQLVLPLITAALLATTGGVFAAGELTYVVNNESAKYDPAPRPRPLPLRSSAIPSRASCAWTPRAR